MTKLQVAIDRVPLDKALNLAQELDGIVDIIELGTSIVKDYGLEALKKADFKLEKSQLLIDLKTIDEGEYEFVKGYETSANILTVMGASSLGTLKKTYEIAQDTGKDIFIDLMEIDDQKVNEISNMPNAIYGLHHSKDATTTFNAVDTIQAFHESHPEIKKIAVAGGVDLDQAKKISNQGIADVIIVGGKIAGSSDPISSAKEFMEAIQ
ncbi:orotidine 5'-phosphate decarboxylase / HUMPS family protein [Weissella bombi]|uniref:3-hexulose-6-phosphate synthase n=1 Tax=Weissella bombi TaxID=1505725 RepID=A0A1C4A7Q6_9LACO|nr:orotidine 5'-phosphate decarboxylase / HUMPS family protein [Weissella bombi]SCB90688.1 3-hexulose-6-phosphate synthase [Weissella bombi]